MDEDLLQLLKKWWVSDLHIDRLKDQEVWDISTLLVLSDTEIDIIFDKCGPRAHFKARIKEAIESFDLTEEQLTDIAFNIIQETHEMAKLLCKNGTNPDAVVLALPLESGESDENANNNVAVASLTVPAVLDPAIRPSLEGSNTQPIASHPDEGRHTPVIPAVVEPQEHPHAEIRPTSSAAGEASVSSVGGRKRQADDTQESSALKRLCQSCVSGKVVLGYYKEHNELNEEIRNHLPDVILNDYLCNDLCRKLPFDVEKSMADSIIQLFPTEPKEIWISSNSGRNAAVGRGKLITRYYGKRRIIRKSGMLKKDDDEGGSSDLTLGDLAEIGE